MVDVGRYDHVPNGNFVANEFGRDLLAFGDEKHFLGEQAFAREMHLRHVGVTGTRGLFATLRDPLGPRLHQTCAITIAAVGSTHTVG